MQKTAKAVSILPFWVQIYYYSYYSYICCNISVDVSSPAHRFPLQDYGRVALGYEDLFRRKQEQWAHHHHHHSANRPSQSSPIFTIDFGTEVSKQIKEMPISPYLHTHTHTTLLRGFIAMTSKTALLFIEYLLTCSLQAAEATKR